MKLFKFKAGLILMSFLLVACGGEESYDETITINPSNPVGSIGGVVFDGTTDAPLANVNITAVVGGQSFTATTDESGVFSISEVPATGKALLIYESEGYLNARQQVMFSESEGDQTYENPNATANPIWLFSANGSFGIKIFDYEGKPVVQVPVTLEMNPSYLILDENDTFVQVGEVVKVANSSNNGLVEFLDLPDKAQIGLGVDSQIKVRVPEVDLDGDGQADLNSTTRTYSYLDYEGTTPTIILSEKQAGGLSISNTNFSYLKGSYKIPETYDANDSIFILFSRTIDPESLSLVLLSDQINGSSWTIEPTVDGPMVTFDLPGDLEANKKYYLSVYATTPGYGYTYSRTSPLFTTPDSAPEIVNIVKDDPLVPDSPVTVTFNQYVGPGYSWISSYNGNNGVIYLSWDLDTSGTVGDYSGEIGYHTTNISFSIDEEIPSWLQSYYPGSRLGFSKTWKFTPPTGVNAGTEVHFKFDMISDSSYIFITPEGNPVPNLSSNLP